MNTKVKIIDPHHHLWDLSLKKHSWLIDSIEDFHIGDYSQIRKSYLIADYLNESKKYEIVKSVHLQAGYDRSDYLGETQYVNDETNKIKHPLGVISYADFSQNNVEDIIENHLIFNSFRGIRQIINHDVNPYFSGCSDDYLNMPNWRKNISILGKYNLSFDMQIYPSQVDSAFELIKANQSISFIINHMLMPQKRNKEYFSYWKDKLNKISKLENTFIKISGFGMFEHNWSESSITPWILEVIEAFGIDRCMFASNFPVDKLYKSFDEIYDIFTNVVNKFSLEEKHKLFYANADKIYRLESLKLSKE